MWKTDDERERRRAILWRKVVNREMTLRELLSSTLQLFVKKQWLKKIDKETNKYFKLKNDLDTQRIMVNRLIKEYNKHFKEDLGMR